jgi:hypothetical protein
MTSRSAFAILVAAAFVAACGDRTDTTWDQTDRDGLAGDTAWDEPAGELATIRLDEVNDSGISGDAAANHEGDSVRIGLSVSGLESGTSYAAHIHTGSCEAGGPVRAPLQSVTGGEDGMGTSTTTLASTQLPADQRSFIQVHGPGGQPVACGDIEGHGEDRPRT